MKILFCLTYSKSFLSGFFFDVCKKLTAEGYTVSIYSLKSSREYKTIESIPIYIEKKGGYWKNYYSTYKIINKVKPDIIISNFNYVYPALLCGRLTRVSKNIAWFHTESSHTRPGPFNILIKKWFSKLADNIIVNSPRLREDLIVTFSVTKEKINIVPFWTAISTVSHVPIELENTGVFKIGCPGRIVKGKNHEVLLDALLTLKSKSQTCFKLYIAGTGDVVEDVKKQTLAKGLTKEVVFLGDLTIQEMPGFYKAMDLIVLPSLQEAFGMVFLEAMSLEVPVLVSDRFGALEFLSSEVNLNAFQFNPLDEKELADKIKLYMEGKGCSPAYFKTLYNKHFSREKTFHSFMKVLQE